MVSKKQYEKVLGYIDSANKDDAKLIVGGWPWDVPDGEGYYIEPTIFTNMTSEMKIFQEEVFGPVVTVTTFKTEEEAVALANDTTYGLGRDLDESALAEYLEEKVIHVNLGLEFEDTCSWNTNYKSLWMRCTDRMVTSQFIVRLLLLGYYFHTIMSHSYET